MEKGLRNPLETLLSTSSLPIQTNHSQLVKQQLSSKALNQVQGSQMTKLLDQSRKTAKVHVVPPTPAKESGV